MYATKRRLGRAWSKSVLRGALFGVLCMCGVTWAQTLDVNLDRSLNEDFPASVLNVPEAARTWTFTPDTDRANFTYFKNAEDIAVEDGVLSFTMKGGYSVLGWGNYEGAQKPREVKLNIGPVFHVFVNMRQPDGDVVMCELRPCVGDSLSNNRYKRELKKGRTWTPVLFRNVSTKARRRGGLNVNGFMLELRARAGSRIEIRSVEFKKPFREGWLRTEFTLPQGKVWRAVADVMGNPEFNAPGHVQKRRLYINGQVVPRRFLSQFGANHTQPVDIAPFLKQGKNCLGFYCYESSAASVRCYLNARIVMETGETIDVSTSPRTWTCGRKEEQGWAEPGFDDSHWEPVRVGWNTSAVPPWQIELAGSAVRDDLVRLVTVDDAEQHSGAQSMKLAPHSTEATTYLLVNAPRIYGLEEREKYVFRVWVKSDRPGTPFAIHLFGYGFKGGYFGRSDYTDLEAGPEWKQVETLVETPQHPLWLQSAVKVTLRRDKAGVAPSLWVDDAELVRVVPEGKENLLTHFNPGFEDRTTGEVPPRDFAFIRKRNTKGPCLAGYKGRLVIENPLREHVVFRQKESVRLNVRMPAGLASAKPASLDWVLGKADMSGRSTEIARGSIKRFEKQGDSLKATLDLGRRSHGVYTVALALIDATGRTIETRAREPFMVLRRIESGVVAGAEFTDGMDLELEDEIDCTNPDDPHPWIESIPPKKKIGGIAEKVTRAKIVRRAGLVYREVTGSPRGSGFSYRVQFKHPGSFYVLELTYPDDARRTVSILLSTKVRAVWTNSQLGTGYETGGRFLNTGEMKTLYALFVAESGPMSIDLINVIPEQRAAAGVIRFHRVKGDLPSLGAGRSRLYGWHSERCARSSGHGMVFGAGKADAILNTNYRSDPGMTQMARHVWRLVWDEACVDRMMQYLKFAGMNTHLMGVRQYDEGNTPLDMKPFVDTSRVPQGLRIPLAYGFEFNAIDWYASVEYCRMIQDITTANDAEVAVGADTAWMVDAEGRQVPAVYSAFSTCNWMHPKVRDTYLTFYRDLGERLQGFRHCKGVQQQIGFGYWLPGLANAPRDYAEPLKHSYDDATWEVMARELRWKDLPAVDDPDRFAKRAALLEDPDRREAFLTWRCREFAALTAAARSAMREARDDFDMFCLEQLEESKLVKTYLDSGASWATFCRDFGVSFSDFKRVDVPIGRWSIAWRDHYGRQPYSQQDPYLWLKRLSPDIIAPYRGQKHRITFARMSWDESSFYAGGHARENRWASGFLAEGDWIVSYQRTRAQPMPAGIWTRDVYVQNLITDDPDMLLGAFTDIMLPVGQEDELRELVRAFTHLPREKFRAVLDTGLDSNVAIRALDKAGVTWFYVVNPLPVAVKGTLTVASRSDIRTVPDGTVAYTGAQGNGLLAFDLEPLSLSAYRASGLVPISAWQASAPDPGVLRTLHESVQEIAGNAGLLDRLEDEQSRTFLCEQAKAIDVAYRAGELARMWLLVQDYRFWEPYIKIKSSLQMVEAGPFILSGWQTLRRDKTEDQQEAKDAGHISLSDARAGWVPITERDLHVPSGRVGFRKRYGVEDGYAYLGNRFRVDKPGTFEIRLGHDGGAALFLDGERVLCENESRPPITVDRTVTTVELAQGEHEIVIAVDIASGVGCGIRFRFGVPEGGLMLGTEFPYVAEN